MDLALLYIGTCRVILQKFPARTLSPGIVGGTETLDYLSPAPQAEPQAAVFSSGLSAAPQAAGASAGLSAEPQAEPQAAAEAVSFFLFQPNRFESAMFVSSR